MNENEKNISNAEINQDRDFNNISSNVMITNHNESVVTPINEVRIETSDTTIENLSNDKNKVLENQSILNSNTELKKVPNNKPNNKSTILLIILFIFLFTFIMGMPYINDFVKELRAGKELSEIEKEAKKEEERQKQEEKKKENHSTEETETKELICTFEGNATDNYTLTQIQKFYYNQKNQIINSKNISQYHFISEDNSYLTLKQQCEEDSLKYLAHAGYTMSCNSGEMNIEISHEFDLESFKPIEEANIQANATYLQNVDSIKIELTNQGYTCQ